MAVKTKRGNGIFYFIIIVLILALGSCVFFLMKNGETQTAVSSSVTQEDRSILIPDETAGAREAEERKSVLEANGPVLGSTEEATAPANPVEGDAPSDKKESEKQQVSSVVTDMVTVIGNYFSSKTPEERLKYVLNPEKIAPKMKRFYSRIPMKTGKVKQLNLPVGMPMGGYAYWRSQGFLEDGSPLFVALRIIDGKPKIDWESEVRYCDFDWEEWLDNEKTEPGEFRVYAKIDGVYSDPFNDSARYRCLQLKTMDSPRTIFAYLNVEDFDQKDFYDALVKVEGGSLECLLKLERVKSNNSDVPTARILEVISPSWINPGTRDDD